MANKANREARLRQVAQLRADGHTLAYIGRQLNISLERARQLHQQAVRTLAMLPQPVLFYGLYQAAKALGVSARTVTVYIRRCNLAGKADESAHGFRLTDADLECLRAAMIRHCVICGAVLPRNRRGSCGAPACVQASRAFFRQQLLAGKRVRGMSGIPKLAVAALAKLPADLVHTFVPFKRAIEVSGLTSIKLWWLFKLKIMATQDSSVACRRTGRPVRLYSLEQARAIGAAVDARNKSNPKSRRYHE